MEIRGLKGNRSELQQYEQLDDIEFDQIMADGEDLATAGDLFDCLYS